MLPQVPQLPPSPGGNSKAQGPGARLQALRRLQAGNGDWQAPAIGRDARRPGFEQRGTGWRLRAIGMMPALPALPAPSSMTMTTEEVSLRPLSLRPGGAGALRPFANFAAGAGVGLKNKVRGALLVCAPGCMRACGADHGDGRACRPPQAPWSVLQHRQGGQAAFRWAAAAQPRSLPAPAPPPVARCRRADPRHAAAPAQPSSCSVQQVALADPWQRAAALHACLRSATACTPPLPPILPLLPLTRVCAACVWALQVVSAAPPEERKKKPPGEVIRYSRDFLMKFVQVRCWWRALPLAASCCSRRRRCHLCCCAACLLGEGLVGHAASALRSLCSLRCCRCCVPDQ